MSLSIRLAIIAALDCGDIAIARNSSIACSPAASRDSYWITCFSLPNRTASKLGTISFRLSNQFFHAVRLSRFDTLTTLADRSPEYFKL
ncbi:hypothetical protein NKH71_03130 [Mesorhizobium sp. M0983]|uniref:hypothetical protein n=1 Tax=Mesorhizobium sp. M0983 TaxID=2957040 RepID=UPI003336A22D